MTNGEIIRKLLNECDITDEELAKIRICHYNVSETCSLDISCDDCRLKWLKEECKSFETVDELDKGGVKITTNADKIRSMTDEEELLNAIGTGCYRCIYSNGQCDSGYGEGCIARNLGWLRKGADEYARSKTD